MNMQQKLFWESIRLELEIEFDYEYKTCCLYSDSEIDGYWSFAIDVTNTFDIERKIVLAKVRFENLRVHNTGDTTVYLLTQSGPNYVVLGLKKFGKRIKEINLKKAIKRNFEHHLTTVQEPKKCDAGKVKWDVDVVNSDW